MLDEGQSSLKAHSTFAIDFAHYVVGSSQPLGQSNQDIGKLLDTLHHIRTASNDHRFSSKLFPLVHATTPSEYEQHDMPPLRAAIQLLREAEEFIIVNATLSCLASDTVIGPNDAEAYDEHNKLVSMCQTNLETALSKLTLYIKPSYDMVLALILGIVYAISVSNTSLAWVLVGTAYQCSHSLGFHTHSDSSDELSHEPGQRRLLFWAVYFFEKSLSVRLGRSSIIKNYDITVLSLEGLESSECHAICYVQQMVMLAGLAGRIYEQLYSANALRVTEDTRTHRALELSQELHGYCAQAHDTNQLWAQSTGDECEQKQIHVISASDEVIRLSMLTLIYRAMPPDPNSGTTFSLECITSARCALESHQAFIRGFGLQASSLLLSTYVNWTILFTPFIPFTVIFCHTIETRDKEDLSRMYAFLKSIECACQHSNAIAKYHYLFGVLYSVAFRYIELGLPSSPMEEEQLQLRSEVDAHLSALGLHPHATDLTGHTEEANFLTSSVRSIEEAIEQNHAEGNNWAQEQWLGRWVSFHQQMMGLFDNNDFPF
ncbi:Transcription factor, fungi [Penicillium expansum]|uniref:Transcription factor, fungi n=1 Tax=Penicillium expansum TaxID=27334 RepID=A0A0A2I0L5_PENEN|nr:Transcription factor, fungi [Penicillium expansum]KGO36053.1 Transcription factor, fungi [Penicillium expansum]KGO59375.1 Transcription factor, fungi [Penicillium expansum]KGO59419.1 Transcription factor, fungi [Penicillium expansum]